MGDEKQPALIYEQIPKIMADIEAIGKDRDNTGQGYKFRGIDDVYNMLHAILAKHKVFTAINILSTQSEERKSKTNTIWMYRLLNIRYTFYAEDGSSFDCTVIGEGADTGDRASNKAMSVAHKYALIQVFAIPTEDPKDPENDNPELGEKTKTTTPETAKKNSDKLDTKAKESNAKLYRQLVDLINEMHKALIIDATERSGYLKRAKSYQNDTIKLMESIKKLDKIKAQFLEAQKAREKLDKAADEGFEAQKLTEKEGVEQEIF